MKKRTEKIKFPTNEIAKKSFARHLQCLLLGTFPKQTSKPDYTKVKDALLDILEKHPDYNETNGLFSERIFKRWWNGEGFPSKDNRDMLNQALEGLTDLWFNREQFTNRFQLHLASLDLIYIKNRNRKYAVAEAKSFLNFIKENWRPVKNEFNGSFDLCIYGPPKRGGYVPDKKIFDPRVNVEYDLTLGPSSFVGYKIPESIVNIYEADNTLSIIPFMYCLLCINVENNSSFKNDLLVDLLTALKCARFLIPNFDFLFLPQENKIDSEIKLISGYINSVFYSKYHLPTDPDSLGFTFPEYIDHNINTLAFNFYNSIGAKMSEKEITQLCSGSAAEKGSFNDKLEHIEETANRILHGSLDYYFSLFNISGLATEQIRESLSKTFEKFAPSNKENVITTFPTK